MRLGRLLPLLFLSGVGALVLEIAWLRRTAQVAGATAVALAAVLAAVIGGMALGAWLFGRGADRRERPIRAYAALEAGIATYALLSPWLFGASIPAFTWIHRMAGGQEGWGLLLSFVLSVLLVTLPAVLMGGTLPVVAAGLRTTAARRGRDVGWLYAVSTLGGVVGTLLAGFVLLQAYGLAGTMRIAAVFSFAAATGALVLGRGASSMAPAPEPSPRPAGHVPPEVRSRLRRAVFLLAVSGFLGLLAEVAFTRSLVLVFGSTTYAFSTVLATFLFGIAVGSGVGTLLVGPRALGRLETTVACTAALFALSALGVYLLPRLYVLGWAHFGGDFQTGLLLRFALAACLLLPGTLGLGIAFPLGAHVATEVGLGRGTGGLYAWNTLASVLGSTLAVFVLVPWLGPQGTVASVALVAAVAVVVVSRRPALLAFALVAAWGLQPPSGPARERLLSGVFHQPGRWLQGGELDEETWALGDDISFSAYGRESTVAISSWYGRPSVLVDGKTVASAGLASDVQHLALLGHLPMLLHPAPRSVLVVGLGMGTTYEAVELHDPEEVVVVELEPAVAEAAARLGQVPSTLVLTDARTHLRATSDRYDVITSDPIHPWVRGGGDLYTREVHELCKRRLAPGGVACLWIPLYQMGLQDVRAAVRTFLDVFADVEAWFTGADLVLVGRADGPLAAPRTPSPPVAKALARLGAEDLAALRLAGRAELEAATRGAPVLTDDSLELEFSTPRQMANPEMDAVLAWVLEVWKSPPPPWGDVIAALRAHLRGDGGALSDAFDRARASAPGHAFVERLEGEYYLRVVYDLARAGEVARAERFLAAAARRLGDDPRLLGVEGDLLEIAGKKEQARAAFLRLLRRHPTSAYLRRRIERLR